MVVWVVSNSHGSLGTDQSQKTQGFVSQILWHYLSLRKTIGKLSLILVTLTSRSDSNFERPNITLKETNAMFTLYRIVKRSVAESVPDRASFHTRTAAFEAVSAPEQYCSAPLRCWKWNVPYRIGFWYGPNQVWTLLSEQKLQRNLVLVNYLFKSKRSVANCITDRAYVHTGNASEQFLHHNKTLIPVHTVPEQLLKRSKNLSGTVWTWPKPDGVDWNSDGLDYCVRNNKEKFSGFRQTDLAKEGCLQKLFYCLIQIKEPCVTKYEGLPSLKILETEVSWRNK